MPLVWKEIFKPTSKIATVTRIDENFQPKMDEIASIAVAAALAEIERDDGSNRSGGRDLTKTRGRVLAGQSYRSTSTHDSPYHVTGSSCSVSTFSYDDFTQYDCNQLFSALREKIWCEAPFSECNDDNADESRDEKGLTSDSSDTGSIYSIESKDSFRECIAKPPKNARVLFSDTGSCYSIVSKYDQGTSMTVKGDLRKKGDNWDLWTTINIPLL